VTDGAFTKVDVVVEPVLHGRPYPELDAGVEGFQRFGKQVRTAVPEGVLTILIVPREQGQGTIARQGDVGVAHLAVHLGGKYIARKSFADIPGHVHGGGALVEAPDRTVREGDIDLHGCMSRTL